MGTTKDLLKGIIACCVVNLASGIFVTRLRADSECPMSGYFRDETNCRKFYRCAEHPTGVPGQNYISKVEFDCPQGTIFDEATSSCNHIMFVQNIPPGCDVNQAPPSQSSGDSNMQMNNPGLPQFTLPEHSQMVPMIPGREQGELSSMLTEPPMPPSLPPPPPPPSPPSKLEEPSDSKPLFPSVPSISIPQFPGINLQPPTLPPFPSINFPQIPGIQTKPGSKPAPLPPGVEVTSQQNVEQNQAFMPFNLQSGSSQMAHPVNSQIPNLPVDQFQLNSLNSQNGNDNNMHNFGITAIHAGQVETRPGESSWISPNQFSHQENAQVPVKQEPVTGWVVPNNFPTFYSPYRGSPILLQTQSQNIPASPIILIR